MRMQRDGVAWVVTLGLALVAAAPARAAVDDIAAAGGVLDRASVPPSPQWDGGPDWHRSHPPLTADAIAVPTPTAAQSGLAVLATIIGLRAWRRGRRSLAGSAQ